MMINELISALIWLIGVLDFFGMIGGVLLLLILAWMAFTHRGRYALSLIWQMPEYRCYTCAHTPLIYRADFLKSARYLFVFWF